MQGFLRMLVTAVALWLGAANAQEAEPFQTRNLSPLVSILGLPTWQVNEARHRFGLTSELANHFRLSQRGDNVLILDGETWRTSLYYDGRVTARWSVGVEIPYYQHSGGVLDDLVDAWHSAFNLPDGRRDSRAEDALWFLMDAGRGAAHGLHRRSRGLGDLQLHAARRTGAEQRLLVRGTVKLPTGDEDTLTGSGSHDAAVTLLWPQRAIFRARPAGFFLGAGLVWTGSAAVVPFEKNDTVLTAVAGGSWKIWPRMGLKVQVDYHGAFYETSLRELGRPAVQGTFGGWRELGRRGRLEFAVSEDLQVSTSPDVVLHWGVAWRW